MDSSNQAALLVDKEKEVDPFLIEALQNPRHRLTILRIELDIQNFLLNSEQHLELQHLPTSYLRLAAHRIAQHYGLQTMVLDNSADGSGIKIMMTKAPETKYPSVCLSEVPAKESENDKLEPVKIAIRPRPDRASSIDADERARKRNQVRSMEERKEEYDKARARIFSSPNSPTSDDTSSGGLTDGKTLCSSRDEHDVFHIFVNDTDKNIVAKDVGNPSRVAIFKDREKDRTDPDYDRSYNRYVRSFPTGQRILTPFSGPQFQPHLVQHDQSFPQMVHIPMAQSSLNYGPSSNQAMVHYGPVGLTQASRDAIYMQWPSPTMMYSHSHEQFQNSFFLAPFPQQPLSFDYSRNH